MRGRLLEVCVLLIFVSLTSGHFGLFNYYKALKKRGNNQPPPPPQPTQPAKAGVCRCPTANRNNLQSCDLATMTFLAKRTCCDNLSPDFITGHYHCSWNQNDDCECQNVPQVDYCRENSDTKGTFQAKDECCNGKNPKGSTYKCAYEGGSAVSNPPQAGVCRCPTANRNNLQSCDLASKTFLGKRTCCDNLSPDFITGHYHCSWNQNDDCECQNVPQVDYCRENADTKGTFQAKDECCNGKNLKGSTYKCAYEGGSSGSNPPQDNCPANQGNGDDGDVNELEEFEKFWNKQTLEYSFFSKEMQVIMKEKRKIYGDIVFVIDGSDGVDENSYRQTRNFVVKFIKYFTVGEKSARFGAILFGDEPRKICGLSKFNNNKDIAKEIYLSQRINFSPDVNTHRALDLVIESEIFGIEAGGRSDAPDILILIGGGKSSEKEETLFAAKRLKSRGITIIAISVGGEGSKEFAGLSTSPSDFYSVSSFGELLTIIVKIIERTVKVIITPETLPNEESYSSMVDLFFLMESGVSVGSSNHRKVLEFFSSLVKPFSVGDRGARVGALLYSDRVQKLFDLKTLGTKDLIVKTILNAPYLGGRANSYVAFNNLLSVFTTQSGGRLNAKRVVVFLTDEKTDKDSLTRKAALLVKNFGVIVLAIGVGDVEMTFLRSVASSSSEVFWVTGFDELASIRWAISHQIYYIVSECVEELHQKEIPEKQEIPKMPDTKVKLPPPVHPCRIKADVIFCLDSSGSIGPGNYQTMLQFAAELATNFPLGKDLAAIACVVFSNVANRRFDLGDYTSISDVTEALLLTPYLESTTNTHLALQLISNLDMFDSESGGRDDAAKIVIFMTDGQSTYPELTVEAAQRLQLQGVNIFSIGIGNYTLSELISVASDPRYVFTALDFKFLDKVKEKVAEKACEVPKEQKSTNLAKFASFNEEI